jgi:hypothetical protein
MLIVTIVALVVHLRLYSTGPFDGVWVISDRYLVLGRQRKARCGLLFGRLVSAPDPIATLFRVRGATDYQPQPKVTATMQDTQRINVMMLWLLIARDAVP